MAVTIINSQVYQSGAGGFTNVHTFPNLNVSGSNTVHIAAGFNKDPVSEVSSWTSNGNAMTGILNSVNAGVVAVQTLFRLINNAVVSTVSNTPSFKLQAGITVGLAGVNQTTPIADSAAADGFGSTGEITFTGQYGNMLLVFIATQDDKTFTASNCALENSVTSADGSLGSGFLGYVEATGLAQTIGATWTGGTNWRLVVVEVENVTPPTPPVVVSKKPTWFM